MYKIMLFVFFSIQCFGQSDFDLHECLMNSTFKITGKGMAAGTVFIIGKPSKVDTTKILYVLVTANHVLEEIQDSVAIIHFRKLVNSKYIRLPITVPIRKNNRPMWTKHPEVDCAAMYIAVPTEAHIQLSTTSLLATDMAIKQHKITAGFQLFALGYPFGAESNEAGFPILRTGTLASYPILPTNETKKFLFDFEIFRGNSGGPVYIVNRGNSFLKDGKMGIARYRYIMGLVTNEINLDENISSLYESRMERHPLKIAEIIHSSLILETINLLPDL